MSEWISVGVTPPPDDATVLLVVKNEWDEQHLEIGRCAPSRDYGVNGDGYVFAKLSISTLAWVYYEVTHWQPLPELPEGDVRE